MTNEDLTKAEWGDLLFSSETVFGVCDLDGARFANNDYENFKNMRQQVQKHYQSTGQYLDCCW
eukprot:216187-Rhodomonas_salina.1